MPIPDFQTIMLPFMKTLENGQLWAIRDLTESLAIYFNLTDSERHELLPSGQQTIFSNRVAWAKSHMKRAGLIDNPSRGKLIISDVGRQVLRQNPIAINCKFLRQFPSYLTFIGAVPTAGEPVESIVTEEDVEIENSKTPLELIESSFEALRKVASEDLHQTENL